MRAISKAKLAELAGVSRAAVTKAAANGLKAAVSGKQIDVDHPDVIAWLLKKQSSKTTKVLTVAKPKAKKAPKKPATKKATPKKKTLPKEPEEPTELPPVELPDDELVRDYGNMKFKDLVAQFGTGARFKDWTTAVKNLEAIRGLQIKNEEKEGFLISRDLVRLHVFGAIENTYARLLTDTPKTLSKRLASHVKAGRSLEEGEEIIRKVLSTQLKNVKATAQRALEDDA